MINNTVKYPKEFNLKFLPMWVVYHGKNKVDIYVNEKLAMDFFSKLTEGQIWKKTDEGTHFLETFIEQKFNTFQ